MVIERIVQEIDKTIIWYVYKTPEPHLQLVAKVTKYILTELKVRAWKLTVDSVSA